MLVALLATGCADQACFRISQEEIDAEFEGKCPSRADAMTFFTNPDQCGPSLIKSVDSDGTFDATNQLCCYSVTKNPTNDNNGVVPTGDGPECSQD